MPKCQIVDETQRAVKVLLLFSPSVTHKKRNKLILGLGSGHYTGRSVCPDFHLSGAGEIFISLQFWGKFKEKIKGLEAESFEVLLLRQSECNSYDLQ